MNEEYCFDCHNVFDPQKGHNCVHGWQIDKICDRKNANFPTKVQENDCESQLIFPATGKESSNPTSVINVFKNSKLDISSQPFITDLQTNSDFQLSQSSECASEKMNQKLILCNSGQSFFQELAKRDTDVQAKPLSHSASIIGCNLPLESGICNSQIQEDNCGTNDIRSQFSNYLLSNSENNKQDFSMASMIHNSMMLSTIGSDFSSQRYQQRGNVKIDQLLLKHGQDHSEERKLHSEFETKITVSNNEMVPKETRLSEMSQQFYVARQTLHDSVQEYELENMSDPATIEVKSTTLKLKSSNMSTVELTTDCTVTGTLNSHENELIFGNQIYHEDQKQIAPAETPCNPDTTGSIQPCLADAMAAVNGSSCSRNSQPTCPICEKKFSSKTNLIRHYQVHSGAKPFACNVCRRKFNDKSNLKRHVHLIHLRKKLQCNICEKSFPTKNALDAHIEIHKRAKHKCDICEKTFPKEYSLNLHIRRHSAETPYKCDVCNKAFAWRNSLLVHVKRRHKIT